MDTRYSTALRRLTLPSLPQARDEILSLHDGGVMASGKMSSDVADHGAWRNDRITWLNAGRKHAAPAACALDTAVNALCDALGDELRARDQMALTSRHDAQISCFPGNGAAFKRHYGATVHAASGTTSAPAPPRISSSLPHTTQTRRMYAAAGARSRSSCI